jgi:hypothetical protein
VALVLALVLVLLPMNYTARAATVTVDSTTDVNDGDTSSISALIADPGLDDVISLREAIVAANNTSDADTINFDIPGCYPVCTIQPTSALPFLSGGGTTINGYSQSGAAEATDEAPAILRIEIVGSGVANNGFNITSAGNVIKGLVINRFSWNGIAIGTSAATGNIIAGNNIGTGPSGGAYWGNGYVGVYICLGAQNNTVGGTTPAERNVISGNGWDGVYILGSNTTGNTVSGNYIGILTHGVHALGNSRGTGSTSPVVLTTTPSAATRRANGTSSRATAGMASTSTPAAR